MPRESPLALCRKSSRVSASKVLSLLWCPSESFAGSGVVKRTELASDRRRDPCKPKRKGLE